MPRLGEKKKPSIKDVIINKGINTEVVSPPLAQRVCLGSKGSGLCGGFGRNASDEGASDDETAARGDKTRAQRHVLALMVS